MTTEREDALNAVNGMIEAIKEDHGDEFPSDYTLEVLGRVLYDHLKTIREALSHDPQVLVNALEMITNPEYGETKGGIFDVATAALKDWRKT